MLSDEEKQAIDWFREDLAEEKENCGKYNDYKKQVIRRNERLLNLIEKQSKEIDELKDKCKELIFEKQELTSALLDSTPDDKIKAEIEELKEDIKYSANPLSIDNSKFGIKVLQSLLEKE